MKTSILQTIKKKLKPSKKSCPNCKAKLSKTAGICPECSHIFVGKHRKRFEVINIQNTNCCLPVLIIIALLVFLVYKSPFLRSFLLIIVIALLILLIALLLFIAWPFLKLRKIFRF